MSKLSKEELGWRKKKKLENEANEMQAIFTAFIHIKNRNEIWSQKNLEKKLQSLNLMTGLSDKKKRMKLVEKMTKDWTYTAQGFRMFDTIDKDASESNNGNALFLIFKIFLSYGKEKNL